MLKNLALLCVLTLTTPLAAHANRGGTDAGVVDLSQIGDNPDALFDEVSMKYVKKETAFALPVVQVSFATRANYVGRYEAALDKGPKAEISVVLRGVSDDLMQSIADEAARIAAEEIAAAGFEAVPASALEGNKGYEKLLENSPPRGVEEKVPALLKSSGASHLKTFTANDGPIWTTSSGPQLYKMQSGLKKGSAILAFTVDFSTYNKSQSKTVDYDKITKTVEIEALPLINLGSQGTWVSRKSTFGMLNSTGVWSTDVSFVTNVEQLESGEVAWDVDPEAFQKAVTDLIRHNIKMQVAKIQSLSK